MSLNYDLRQVPEEHRDLDGISQDIIFRMPTLELSEITEDNIGEFHARDCLTYGLYKEWRVPEWKPFKVENLRNHVGLKVNVSEMSRRQFLAKVNKQMHYTAREI